MKPITFHIFVHDDVTLSDRVLGLQSSLMKSPFEIQHARNIPGVTNFKYASQNAQAVADRWMAVAADLPKKHPQLGLDPHRPFTQGKSNDQVLGAALR